MVGSALLRRLARENCTILTAASSEVDLRRQSDTESLFAKLRPRRFFLAARESAASSRMTAARQVFFMTI